MIIKFLSCAIALLLIGGLVFLATWDMPPPQFSVEKTVAVERHLG